MILTTNLRNSILSNQSSSSAAKCSKNARYIQIWTIVKSSSVVHRKHSSSSFSLPERDSSVSRSKSRQSKNQGNVIFFDNVYIKTSGEEGERKKKKEKEIKRKRSEGATCREAKLLTGPCSRPCQGSSWNVWRCWHWRLVSSLRWSPSRSDWGTDSSLGRSRCRRLIDRPRGIALEPDWNRPTSAPLSGNEPCRGSPPLPEDERPLERRLKKKKYFGFVNFHPLNTKRVFELYFRTRELGNFIECLRNCFRAWDASI